MKNWVRLILCLLLSAGIWLIHNLSLTYVEVVSVPVIAQSNLDGRASTSSTDNSVVARVKASGFRLARFSGKHRRPVAVNFDASDFRHIKGDVYVIQASSLQKYVKEIFGDVENVESFITESMEFSFAEATHRKVPVRQVASFTFAEQYTATSAMTMKPDSVTLYGELSRLDNIEYVLTRPISMKDLSSNVHGVVKLEIPKGLRASTTEVNYSLDVSRYVEIKAEVPVYTANVPSNVDLAVLPSKATVTFRCLFPATTDPSVNSRFYVDYQDFAKSMTGRCVARVSGLPAGVIDYRMDPEVFDCVLKTY